MKRFEKKKLYTYFQQHKSASVHELSQHFGISTATVHKYIKELLATDVISKVGKPPQTIYMLQDHDTTIQDASMQLDYMSQEFLQHHFLSFDEIGHELVGHDGFVQWCLSRWLDPEVQFWYYKNHIDAINAMRDSCGFLHQGFTKFVQQMKYSYLADLLYFDTYQLAQFGKSTLASLAFFAKQSQSLSLLDRVAQKTQWQIRCHIVNNIYDAVCYVPHSLTRKHQLLPTLRSKRSIPLPEIYLHKLYSGEVIVPQKSLKWAASRIRNARHTIFIKPHQESVHHVLLIDDFVWSGATLNESAKKLLDAGLAQRVTGMALVGNIDMTYEVINEI